MRREGVLDGRSGGVQCKGLVRYDVRLNKTVGEYWIPHSWSILPYNKLATRMGLNLNPLTPFLQNLGEPSMPFMALHLWP